MADGSSRIFVFPSGLRDRDCVVKYWVRGDLMKAPRNLQWCSSHFDSLSDQVPIAHQKLKDEYLDYKFVGLPATSSMVEPTGSTMETFVDVPGES